MSDRILALDFGGTKLTAALIALADIEAGKSTWRGLERIFSPPDPDVRYDIETMMALGRKLLAGATPAAVGVSFGGPVDFQSGTVRLSHHVSGWENTPLQRMLEGEFGAPARVDNDANVAALGEFHFGAGQGAEDMMYITISTGVGGGWVLDGRPWRGYEGMAGEIGHTVVDPAGPRCLCGKRGCVERLASGPYMAQDLREAWGAAGRDEDEIANVTGKVVAEAAYAGDEIALGILERGAWALGVGIGNAANFVNPQLFVLGGGVAKSGELWWSAVRKAARNTALPEIHFHIEPAVLGDDAPLWGAVALGLAAITLA